MSARLRASFVSFVALASLALAQEPPPGPAPELQKLAPLVGNWEGSGDATFAPGAPPTKWTARGTYRWALDKHFVQEDFEVTFAGQPVPMVIRAYLGWDRENRRYVNAIVGNGGEVQLHGMTLLPDGTFLQMMLQSQDNVPHAERSVFKVDGDKLTHSITLLMMAGPSMSIVDGQFTRGGKGFDGAPDAKPFEGVVADAALQKLARSAGKYKAAGQFVMGAGQPAMKITGEDTVEPWFGGTVLHAMSVGTAEGMPGEYRAECFWGHDETRGCLVCLCLSSMGEVGAMEGRYAEDGRLVCTSSALWMGKPTVQSMVMTFDDKGALKEAHSNTIVGTSAPFESYRAAYTRQ